MKIDRYTDSIRIETYFGRELSGLPTDKLLEIATCYKEVFNQSWSESWSTDSALREIKASFQYSNNRVPLVSVMWYQDRMIGFAWGLVVSTPDDLISERDMPFSISPEKQRKGVEVSKYWLQNIAKNQPFLLYRELGVLQEHRGRMTPFLTCSSYQKANEEGCKALLFWTSTKSRVFTLGLGVRWSPIHFFMEKDLCIMVGNLAYTQGILEDMVKGNASDESYQIVFDNISVYTCEK